MRNTQAADTEISFPDIAEKPAVDAQALMRHPRFPAALRLYVQMTIDACHDDLAITKMFGNATEHIAFSLIATHAARSALIDGAPLLTPTRLIGDVMAMGLANHGKVEAVINRLVDRGMIVKVRLANDRRITELRPTKAFVALDATLNRLHAMPAAMLVDDPLVASIAAGDLDAIQRMRTASKPTVEKAGAMLQRAPQILHFVSAEAGWLILLHLVDAIWRSDARGRRYEALAQRCAVTRPHVRNVLLKARDYGLLQEDEPGILRLTEDFEETFKTWVAEILAAFLECCREAQHADACQALLVE